MRPAMMTAKEVEVFLDIIRIRETKINDQARKIEEERSHSFNVNNQLSLLRMFLKKSCKDAVKDFNIWADAMDPNYYGMGVPEKI